MGCLMIWGYLVILVSLFLSVGVGWLLCALYAILWDAHNKFKSTDWRYLVGSIMSKVKLNLSSFRVSGLFLWLKKVWVMSLNSFRVSGLFLWLNMALAEIKKMGGIVVILLFALMVVLVWRG